MAMFGALGGGGGYDDYAANVAYANGEWATNGGADGYAQDGAYYEQYGAEENGQYGYSEGQYGGQYGEAEYQPPVEAGLKYAGAGQEAAAEAEYYLNANGCLCYLDDEGYEQVVEGTEDEVGQYEAWQYGFYNDEGEFHYYAEVRRLLSSLEPTPRRVWRVVVVALLPRH